uniref:PARP-type domain-containing protein n=1 Tax=Haptolina brevifila TaxID=156173 RepID=A0A7S2I005_9EUKA
MTATRLQAALDLLVYLNDKFALDGGAAPSYGGLLWCLGWRDRPSSSGAPSRRPTSVITKRVPAGELERRALLLASMVERRELASASVANSLAETDDVDAPAAVETIATTVTALSERWSVEYAKSNRSTCKGCGGKIDKHALRIGDAAGLLSGQYVQWRHLGCHRRDQSSLTHHSHLSGFDILSDADKIIVEAWFDNGSGGGTLNGERDVDEQVPGSGCIPVPPPANRSTLHKVPPAKRARTKGPKSTDGGDIGEMVHFLNHNSAAALTPPSSAAAASITATASSSAAAATATGAPSHTAAPQNTQPTRQMPGTCPTCGQDLSDRGPLRTVRHLQKCAAACRV